jgi:hypothetical protein
MVLGARTVGCALTAALVLAGGAGATTAPGVLYRVPVLLTGAKIVIAKDPYSTANGLTRYPRGAVIEFDVRNRAGVPIRLRLLTGKSHVSGTTGPTRPIAPGALHRLKESFYLRGRFELQALSGGKVRARRPIVIF